MIIEQIKDAIELYKRTELGPPSNVVILNPAIKEELFREIAPPGSQIEDGALVSVLGARLTWSRTVEKSQFVVVYVKPLW